MVDVSAQSLPTAGALAALCRRWKIRELSLFGSLARGEAGPTSDADVLITFEPDEHWDLWHMVELQEDLEKLFGRSVDVVVERTVRNPIRLRSILRDKRQLYAG